MYLSFVFWLISDQLPSLGLEPKTQLTVQTDVPLYNKCQGELPKSWI